MEIVVYVLPFIVAVILLVFFRDKVALWEYAALIIPSILLALLVEVCMKGVNASDTEYLGYYVKSIHYYEEWNEYIHRTCTRQVPCGTDSKGNTKYRTETYDCSYVDNHPERWTYTLNNGDEEYFYNENEFNIVRQRLQAQPKFRDMHRHYYTKDGDAYDYVWDGSYEHCYTMTSSHLYQNYIKSSHSIFKFEDISEDEAKKIGLYDYPNIHNYQQNPIIGINLGEDAKRRMQYLNGMNGYKHQVRFYLLVWKNKSAEISQKQRSYWQGGNKNECVICVGVDDSHTVKWVDSWSWEDEPTIAVKSKSYFLDNGLNVKGFCEYIENEIPRHWKRKEFEDFSYISVELSDIQLTWLFILVLIYNIGMSIWIVMNDFTVDNPNGQNNSWNYRKPYRYRY